jgi:putative transposase
MANTYTQIYLHVVFAVSGRACAISRAHREELQKYITGIVTRQGQKLIAVYCMPDHTHMLLGLKPNIAPSDLIGDIKTGSTNHINEQRWIGCRFSWQEGYGAFSVSYFPCGSCGQLHSKPRQTPSAKVIPAGIC